MGFKDVVAKDVETFINDLEFAEVHNVDGKEMAIVIDSDTLQQRPRQPLNLYHAADGVFISRVTVFARSSDFEYEPVVGQHMRIDGAVYLVNECTERHGILEIVLEVNQA